MRSPRKLSALFVLSLAAVAASAGGAPDPVPAGTDCHMHVRRRADFPQDGDRALGALEGAGLERGCILSGGYQKPEDCKSAECPSQRTWTVEENDWTLRQASGKKNLLPFCGIPIREAWGPDEARRCAKNGARGLKLHPVAESLSLQGAAAEKKMDGISRAAAAAGMPILIHIAFTDEEIEAFYRIAAAHPKTTYIVAHQLGPKVAELKRAPSNVYVDISGLPLAPRSAAPAFVAIWRSVGMKRILLGSDWPLLHPSEYVAALRAFPLTPEERILITEDNARRLFP